ncbi:MAG: nucleotidyltransferase [Microcystis aeruginosa BS13-10]|nr:nucleotidyltransferase [Microcystis aeruginosa BS13-10]
MSIANQFSQFCENLRVPQATRSSISDRYENITKRLNRDFWESESKTLHSLYVGSYGRRTAVRGFSDLDVLFKLPYEIYKKYNSYQHNGQSALLQAVKQSLKKTYSTTDISGDGQVIVINFNDDISFEIVPCFSNPDNSFTYPDSNNGGSLKTTDPIPEIATIKENNELTNKNLIRLCRMTRAWRNKWNVPMGGLLIDTLANNFLINWKYKEKSYMYYDWMSRDFFAYLSNQNPQKEYWLAVGSKQYIHRKGNFEYKAKQSYKLALEAIEYESKGMNYSAAQKWREIYGTDYPN